MRMDFNVLWVENQQDLVQAQRVKIERQIRAEGFRLQVRFAETVDEAISFLDEDIFSDHVDLILMDYDLGPGKKGDEGLVEVRQHIPYRDVVFYSSQANELQNKVVEQGVQGVFCSTRDDLPDTCIGVFESLIKKVVDIDHSRGIVMGTTSDIDHYVLDALTTAFNLSDERGKTEILAHIQTDLEKIQSRFDNAAKSIKAVAHVSDLYDHYGLYTSNDRLELLRKALKVAIGTHAETDAKLVEYIHNIVPQRNTLAHVRVVADGFKRKLLNRKNEELTSENMRALRLALLEHHEQMEALCRRLEQPQGTV